LRKGDAAGEIIAELAARKLGRAALLLPQTSTPPSRSGPIPLPKRALAWAIDKVQIPASIEPVVRTLLEHVVIFSQLEDALECKRDQPTLGMATLAGEYVSREGIVFGGSGPSRSESLLERKAEIVSLEKEQLLLLKERDDVVAPRSDQARITAEAAARNLSELRERHQAAHLAASGSGATISLLEREQSDAIRQIDQLQLEKKTLEQQVSAADEQIAQLRGELGERRAEFAKRQAEQKGAELAGKDATARESELADKLSDLRLLIATGRQRHENLLSQQQTIAAREAELDELIAARRADISSYESKLAEQARQSSESQRAIEEQTAECEQAESTAAAMAKNRATRISIITDQESTLRRLRDSLSELQDHRGQQQVRESQLQMQIENLVDRVSRCYQVDLRSFTPDKPGFEKTLRAQLKRRANADETTDPASARELENIDLGDEDLHRLIADLTRQLDNMGPVNLDAVHEYDELEERYKFLEAQNNDLTNSRRELLDVIARINSTTKKLFTETFVQVRSNFREMFAELFGGGRADLSLMDENDPLNCGIEITAKPPGKQLQSISLLSGGERAMVAVALLFAIYMVRPSPFCVLDEIDAPLDESNINRFIRILERFVEQSQFIIITHNKRTIAKADVLYGVTMEERGVSKLVGMKLAAPRQVAAESGSNGNGHSEATAQRHFALATR
jgi:chromosome segregation protein